MQRLTKAICLVIFGLALPATAPAQSGDAKAIVQKAVQAQGGVDKLTAADAVQRKIKGFFVDDNFKFTGETWSEKGNRLKILLNGDDDGVPQVRILVQNGAEGWNSYNGFVWPFDEPMKKRMEKSAHADKVIGLVSLLRDPGYTLSALGNSSVKNTEVVGVKVQYANQNDVSLYFDKATWLLVKAAYRTIDVNTGHEMFQEIYYSDFHKHDPNVEMLQANKQATDNAALLKFLRQRIPIEAEREQIAHLIGKLGDVKFATRQKATVELQKLGCKAAPQLRQLSASSDPEVVRRAEQLLETVAKGPEIALITAVVRVLAERHPPEAAAALLTYVPWVCNDTISREILQALKALDDADSKAHQVLLAALEDSDSHQRDAAKAVLGKDGGVYLKQPGRRIPIVGVVFARHVTIYRDGKLYLDYDSYDHQFFNCFDEKMFVRP